MLEYLKEILSAFWDMMNKMSPYLLFGFLMAGLLSVFVKTEFIERHLGKGGFLPVLKASLFGVPLPLCSCGVIPVSASLRRSGASKGATTAFLLSTPETGVDSMMVTFSLLGPVYAIFRPVAAFFNGVIGGTLVNIFDSKDTYTLAKFDDASCGCDGDCGSSSVKASKETTNGKLKRTLQYGFVTLPRDIGKALLIGLLIAGVISAVIPKDYFMNNIGTGIGAMLIMMAIAIPVYVCATASVPLAVAFISAGISPGAALVFLMAGPATNAATISTIWKIMGPRTAMIYLSSVAMTSLGSGYILDSLFTITQTKAEPIHDMMLPSYLASIASVILLIVLFNAILKPAKAVGDEMDKEKQEFTELAVEGMTCQHCAASVQKALATCPGVGAVQVDLDAGKAIVDGINLDMGIMRKAVEELGFKARW